MYLLHTKGFENFFPKNKGPTPKSSKTSKKSSKSKPEGEKPEAEKSNPFAHLKDKKKSKSKGGGGSGGKKDDQNQVISAAALLLLVLAARSVLEEDTAGNGREITWSDFYNHILEPGDVDRIVVINGKTARVFLNHGSAGVPLSRGAGAGTGGVSGVIGGVVGVPSSNSRGGNKTKRGGKRDAFEDETVMDMGSSTENVGSSSSPASQMGSRAAQSPKQLVYHFQKQ